MRRFFGLSALFSLCFFLDLLIPQSPLAMPCVGYSPFLCTLLGRSSQKTLFVMAAVCGICHDLFTLQHRLGVSALAYLFAIFLNLIFRRRYYEERIIPFFGVTFSLSLTYSLFFLLFGALKGQVGTIGLKMIHHHLILYPFFDALIGLIGVFIPLKVYSNLKIILHRKRHES